MYKICSRCKTELDVTLFYKANSKKDGLKSQCKECTNLSSKESSAKRRALGIKRNCTWRKRNPDKYLNNRLKLRFNITLEQYNQILKDQDNKCAICKNPETIKSNYTGKIKNLAVDHDHKTGKIRGLLCYNCNGSLGKFKEDFQILENALNYLKSNTGENS